MKARRLLPLGLAMLALALTACNGGRKALPDTTVRVVNVVPRLFTLDFRREESTASTLPFKSGSVFTYDEDTYDFNVDALNGNTGAQQRVLSFPQQVLAGNTYTFVFYDTGTSVGQVTLQAADIPANATDTQVDVVNAATGQPPMDFYLTPTNSGIVGATPLGTLPFLEHVAARRMPADSYEITITAAGDPSTVLFKSQSLNLPAGRYSSFVIAAEAGASNNPISVVAIGDVAGSFVNVNAPASLRVINAAADQGPRDIAVDGQFSPPLFAAVPFATATAYAPVPTSSGLKFNVTPPGNPGTLELDAALSTGPTVQYTVLVSGMPGALSQVNFVDDNRRIPAVGKIRFYNAAPQIPSIDFFVVTPGTDLATVLAD
ncbi:MAG TPA: DUF4397 domain-containing protein, partial [Gammaproteobacteria bacterium]|nr:DUF4397 domain-containing protein [Gammaproteobacteria bacterium]